MTRLFGRVCDVVVQNGQDTALRLTGFRVVATVKRNLRPTPNSVEIKLYNLVEDDRQSIQRMAAGSGTVRVKLLAGYEGDHGLAQLFLGNLRDAHTEPDGPNLVTILSGVDGGVANRTAHISQSFAPRTPVADVLRQVAGSLGVDLGNASEMFSRVTAAFAGGTVVHGPAHRELARLLERYDLEHSIQDNRLQVLPRGAALRTSAVHLTASSGLKGEPSISARGVVTGECLLIPDVVPGRSLDIFSRFVNGVYRCDQVEYNLDTHGADWGIKFEARVPRRTTL